MPARDRSWSVITGKALGLKIKVNKKEQDGATWMDVTLTETTGKDRAVTLLYTIGMGADDLQWLDDPRHNVPVEPRREYTNVSQFRVGSNGRLSRYPFGAVATRSQGTALGIDMLHPAFYRIAYGMFPGFFSHNASQGHYFTQPELYNRDRPLFKKYVPLCRLVAEAGWQPITQARSDDVNIHIERFGDRYLTLLNDSDQRRTVTIKLDGLPCQACRDLLHSRAIPCHQDEILLALDAHDVALLEIKPK